MRQGYFQGFALRNKSPPSALRIHELCLFSSKPPSISDGNLEIWECSVNQNKTHRGTGELLVIEDQVQLSIWGQLLHLQPQPHFPSLQNIDVPARDQLDHCKQREITGEITGKHKLWLSQAGFPFQGWPGFSFQEFGAFGCSNSRGFLISWLRFSNLSRSEMQRIKSQH